MSSNNSTHPTHNTSPGLHHREIFPDFTNFKYSCKACSQNHELGFDGKVICATIPILNRSRFWFWRLFTFLSSSREIKNQGTTLHPRSLKQNLDFKASCSFKSFAWREQTNPITYLTNPAQKVYLIVAQLTDRTLFLII
jgi:hypothetical protein